MKLTLTCSWCHEANFRHRNGLKVFCWSCGHRADVPRVECDCPKCRREKVVPISRKAGQYREAS